LIRHLTLFLTALLVSSAAFASDSDTMNVRISPLLLLAGGISAHFDYKIDPNWTIGIEGYYYHATVNQTGDLTSDVSINSFAGAVRANYFFNGTFKDGVYLAPSIGDEGVTATSSDITGSLSANVNIPYVGLLVGYGWFWDNFNVMLGLGFKAPLGNSKIVVRDQAGNNEASATVGIGLDAEGSIGWTF
jgi:hypothetical protein